MPVQCSLECSSVFFKFYKIFFFKKLPFILACHSMVHLAALHQYGSNPPLVGASPVGKSAFLTDSLIKDLVGWVLTAIGFSLYAF